MKRIYKKPIAAPFQARAIRPVRHKFEAVTAPFSDRGNVGQREEWLSWLRCVAFNGDPSRPGY